MNQKKVNEENIRQESAAMLTCQLLPPPPFSFSFFHRIDQLNHPQLLNSPNYLSIHLINRINPGCISPPSLLFLDRGGHHPDFPFPFIFRLIFSSTVFRVFAFFLASLPSVPPPYCVHTPYQFSLSDPIRCTVLKNKPIQKPACKNGYMRACMHG